MVMQMKLSKIPLSKNHSVNYNLQK